MIPVVYHFPRRTQINETYVTVYEVTVFRHLKITYRKNNPFSLILRKPLPRKPTHDFPLCLHQIQSGSPVIVVSLCFHHFTVLDGQYLFRFHVAVEPVMHVSHHISFPSPKFPTEPAGLNFSSLTISRKKRLQLLHLIHPCRFLLADLIVDIRFYPLQAKIPITHLPESGIAAIIARRPSNIFRKKISHPPAQQGIVSYRLCHQNPFFSFQTNHIARLPCGFERQHHATQQKKQYHFLHTNLIVR